MAGRNSKFVMVTISTTVAVIATGRTDEAPAPHTQYTIDAIEARDLAGGIVFPIDWRNLAVHGMSLILLDDRGMLIRLRDGVEIWLHPEPSGAWRWLPGQKVEWKPVGE